MNKVTIVTVCYNAEAEIEKTMRSVCEQDYPSIEYLIIDGASKDATLHIIEKIKEEYSNKKSLSMRIVSERDNGIYDAMNKGIERATGEWILFLNAGDLLFEAGTMTSVFASEIKETYSGIYGDTLRYSNDWTLRVNGKPLSGIVTGISLPFCHQSIFVRTNLLKQIKFDTHYKLAADYNFFVQCYKKKLVFLHVDVIISKYAMGGVSETSTVNHLKEKIDIRQKNGLENYSRLKRNYMIWRLSLRQKMKRFLPNSVVKRIRGY